MVEPKLTVLVPGIRVVNWYNLYQSVIDSFHGEFEIIFIGPYPPGAILQGEHNVRWIQDWGSPTRCQQIGLLQASGRFVTWAADDGVFLHGALDRAFELMEGKTNALVMGKYIEGADNTQMPMSEDAYYILNNHDASRLDRLGKKYWMLNCGLVSKDMLLKYGGWDCQFEVCPMAYNDLAIRLQNAGIEFIIQNVVMYTCSHSPGTMGDHAPVHFAQIEHDQPLFNKIYDRPDANERKIIPIDTWEQSPERWERRFGPK
jgi:hypothetical protein